MAHYIEADRLRAEIEIKKKTEGWCEVGKDTADIYYARGVRFTCDFVLNLIDSLQQEQPEVDLEEEIDKEWSKEDEKMIKEIHGFLYEASCGIYRSYEKERFNKWESWLNSLCPQSKIHYWTEGEIEPIIGDYLTGKEHYGGMLARLRCLKPRPQWCPSEEQMKALNALNLYGNLSYVGQQNQLISLYQDLKKLM